MAPGPGSKTADWYTGSWFRTIPRTTHRRRSHIRSDNVRRNCRSEMCTGCESDVDRGDVQVHRVVAHNLRRPSRGQCLACSSECRYPRPERHRPFRPGRSNTYCRPTPKVGYQVIRIRVKRVFAGELNAGELAVDWGNGLPSGTGTAAPGLSRRGDQALLRNWAMSRSCRCRPIH